jgi:hypothetical protein
MFRLTRFGSLTLAVLVLATAAVVAKERPHIFKGSGQFAPNQIDFTASGVATHLGKFTEIGGLTSIEPGNEPGVFLITASSTQTAADGDELREEISGELNFVTGVGTATVIYAGGSGRFLNATGTAILHIQLGAGGAFTFHGEGVIDFD